jgi:hypothetical protein
MMDAVVSFMEGVQAELSHQRAQLQRVETVLGSAVGQLAATDSGALQELHPQPSGDGDSTATQAAAQQKLTVSDGGDIKLLGRRMSAKQAVGAAAVVSAGVGAALGVVLATVFSSSGGGNSPAVE